MVVLGSCWWGWLVWVVVAERTAGVGGWGVDVLWWGVARGVGGIGVVVLPRARLGRERRGPCEGTRVCVEGVGAWGWGLRVVRWG